MMRASECPNCYCTVIIMEDGTCPACNKSPDGPTADRTKTKITISEGQVLPDLCFGCGNQTDSVMVVTRSNASSTGRFFRILFGVILFPLKLLVFGMRGVMADESTGREPYRKIKLKIPFCLHCRTHSAPTVVWTNFEEGSVSVIVPKTITDRIRNVI